MNRATIEGIVNIALQMFAPMIPGGALISIGVAATEKLIDRLQEHVGKPLDDMTQEEMETAVAALEALIEDPEKLEEEGL